MYTLRVLCLKALSLLLMHDGGDELLYTLDAVTD